MGVMITIPQFGFCVSTTSSFFACALLSTHAVEDKRPKRAIGFKKERCDAFLGENYKLL